MRMLHLTLAITTAIGATIAGAQTGGPVSSKLQIATGVVKTVSASSLTVEHGGVEIIFAVNASTRFVGKGLASDLVLRPGQLRTALDFVKAGDEVTVKFRQSSNATMNAVEVRVVRRRLT